MKVYYLLVSTYIYIYIYTPVHSRPGLNPSTSDNKDSITALYKLIDPRKEVAPSPTTRYSSRRCLWCNGYRLRIWTR